MVFKEKILLALFIFSSVAWSKTSFEPFLLKGFGTTLYRLEVPIPQTGGPDSTIGNSQGLGQSELEYPLDPILAGFRYRYENISQVQHQFGMGISFWSNLSGPFDKMMDTDWIGARSTSGISTSTVLIKFSETESRAKLAWYGGEAGFDFKGFTLWEKPVRCGFLVRAEYFNYRLYGIHGRQGFPGQTPLFIDTLQDSQVLAYQLLRTVPRIFIDLTLAEKLNVAWKVSISGAPAFAVDHDDHILRRKESKTSAFGFELGSASELDYSISPNLQVIIKGEIAYFRSKGKMSQNFYGDDPFTSTEDETGKSYSGVVTRIISLAGGISTGIRYQF